MGSTWSADPTPLTPTGERVMAWVLLLVIALCLTLAFITGQDQQCSRLLDQDDVSAQRIAEVCGGDSASRSWSARQWS